MTLLDKFGRQITDLRISITDRCNFRCVYCRSADPENYRDHDEILSWPELDRLARDFPTVFVDSRGQGLLLGLKCHIPPAQVQAACAHEGLMAITAGDNVLRLAPPLVVTDDDLDQAVKMLTKAAAVVAADLKAKAP